MTLPLGWAVPVHVMPEGASPPMLTLLATEHVVKSPAPPPRGHPALFAKSMLVPHAPPDGLPVHAHARSSTTFRYATNRAV